VAAKTISMAISLVDGIKNFVVVLLQGPPEEEDQGVAASTFSLLNVGVEAKVESKCK